MKLSKKIARKYIFPVLVNSGLEKSFRLISSHSILNIMYHGVVPKTNHSFSPRHFSSEQFEQHIKYLKKEFDILSVKEAFENYRNDIKANHKAITISFDDGYKNNLKYALPLLEKYKIKTTFFISGVCAEEMETRILWPDVIACLCYFHRNEVIEIENYRFENMIDITSKIKISDFIKTLMPGNRERILTMLVNKYNLNDKLKQIPSEYWEMMNKEDIQKLSTSEIVEIGSHGYLHYNLGNIGESEAATELKKSKELLEGAGNAKVDMIAYPDGSYSNRLKDMAEDLEYDKQLAVDYKCSDDISDKRILNRHGLSPTTTFESNIFFLNKSFYSKGYN
jgi:peptidoglycan/xylan/chitin deacetylase (PgdA/CDA1 family)